MPSGSVIPPPEQGQLVEVRRRHWLVQDVHPSPLEREGLLHHRVTLESLDQGSEGDTLQVIWQREVHAKVDDALELPRPQEDRWDPLGAFDAFLLATRWSTGSVLSELPLQAPFRGAIQVEDYQLEPVVRALQMPRVSLLIADFVGAGKTIEAGLVLRELIARRRARRVLIVCPASLQQQWKEEMAAKFALEFRVVDRDAVHGLRREYGPHVNPWSSFPRLITSMDFLKREEVLNRFHEDLQRRHAGVASWDLLILDEAHHVAPTGSARSRGSDRTAMARAILEHFEHRLFLTATPHDGHTENFTSFLEMLDPLRFTRGRILDRGVYEANRDAVMVRRVKDEITDELGRRRFPERRIDPALDVVLREDEAALVVLLDRYRDSVLARLTGASQGRQQAVRFGLVLLKKRLLSSAHAFRKSIEVHLQNAADPEGDTSEEAARAVSSYERSLDEEWSDDDEKDRVEESALAESAPFFKITPEERSLVEDMRDRAVALCELIDSKAMVLLREIEAHLQPKKGWTDERLVVFTEYRDTLDSLEALTRRKGWSERVLLLHGSMGLTERERVKAAFNAPPGDEPARILLATDCASEGLNLQAHCRRLIHYEIPWNPNRMEQRNGRLDRHGQPADAVIWCQHFRYENNSDQRFLDVVIEKIRTQRDDLGAVADVIASGVEACMLGQSRDVREDHERELRRRSDLASELRTEADVRDDRRKRLADLRRRLGEARETWRLSPENLRLVLDEALRLTSDENGLRHPGLADADDPSLPGAARLANVPWPECRASVRDSKGRSLLLVFDEVKARRRKDVTLIHLDHPLMRRALRTFRAHLWARGLAPDEALVRVAAKVVPDDIASGIHLVAALRVVASNEEGHALHEEIRLLGGALSEGGIDWASPDDLERLVRAPGDDPELSRDVAASLRRYFPAHERLLRQRIEKERGSRSASLRKDLARAGASAAKQVEQHLEQRRKELNARLDVLGARQGRLFEDDDRELARWFERRLADVERRLTSDPARLQAQHAVSDGKVRAFPLALLYVLPSSTSGITGRRARSAAPSHSELYELLRQLELSLREAISEALEDAAWIAAMSPTRLEKARELHALKLAKNPVARLLDCLTFGDYATIASKSALVRDLLGLEGESNKSMKRRLATLEDVRNAVMHHEDLAAGAEELRRTRGIRDDLSQLVDGCVAALARAARERE